MDVPSSKPGRKQHFMQEGGKWNEETKYSQGVDEHRIEFG